MRKPNWARWCALFLTLGLAAWGNANAWNMATHRLIGDIAWTYLSPETRAKAVQLINQHPDFQAGFADLIPSRGFPSAAARERWLFREAGAWADTARDGPFHHGTWHYINAPVYFDPADEQTLSGRLEVNSSLVVPESLADEGPNAVQVASVMIRRLSSPEFDADRALALTWLLHVYGDLHQPMHNTALFSDTVLDGDHGGNRLCTPGEFGNLHWLWDSLVFSGEDAAYLEAVGRDLIASYAEALGREARTTDVHRIHREGHALSNEFVYAPRLREQARTRLVRERCRNADPARFLTIDLNYVRDAEEVARRRVVLAGLRTARLLEELLR